MTAVRCPSRGQQPVGVLMLMGEHVASPSGVFVGE
jgi:hypothetical protein